ncbi:hypothetical protein [Novosphingobium ginsenosidimutans]|nr:hypothetical protein [Novosphingobium ginsenosidimutans]
MRCSLCEQRQLAAFVFTTVALGSGADGTVGHGLPGSLGLEQDLALVL